MMRADEFNYLVDPVRIYMSGTQQIMISHVFYSDERESKRILTEKNILQVFSTDNSESERFSVDESSK